MINPGPGADRHLARVREVARRAERRVRLGRGLEAGTTALAAALVVATVAVVVRKTGHASEGVTLGILMACVLGSLLPGVLAYLSKLPLRAGAVALDRHHGLSDRLSSALSFGDLPASERTVLMNLAIDDAVRVVDSVDPGRAVRIPLPRMTGAAAFLATLLAVVLLFEVRRHERIVVAERIDAVDVDPDDIDAMKDFLNELQKKDQSDDTKAAIDEFNQLIEDIAKQRLDRTEAFRRMQALEDKLLEGREADRKSLEEALEKIGEEMKKAELSKPAGEALENKNLAQAEQDLHDLAKKLREDGKKVDKAKLDQLRDALKKAAADQAKKMQDLQQKRDQLADDILKQKKKMGDNPSEQDKDLLRKKERELDRLDRELNQQQQSGRQLDRLDRELSQAAEDLMRDMGASAEDLDQGAEDLNRMAKEEMTEEEKEQLRQKIDELREIMRQQGQGGQAQKMRLRRFQMQARGQSGQRGRQGQGQGQEGQGQEGQGEEGQGQEGQGQEGQGQEGQGQEGQGQQGQGQGQGQGQRQGGEVWVLGPHGEKILMITQGHGQSGNGGQPGGANQGQPGRGWGEGHDANLQGRATNPNMKTEDTQVAGQDTGQGGSRSEVILGAADRGFKGRGYKRVYTEYHDVAEEALNKDEIPGGYRFYVRRYFQLIRPREEQ